MFEEHKNLDAIALFNYWQINRMQWAETNMYYALFYAAENGTMAEIEKKAIGE